MRYTIHGGVQGYGAVQKYHVHTPSIYARPAKLLKNVPAYAYGVDMVYPKLPSKQAVKKMAPYAAVPLVGVVAFLALPTVQPPRDTAPQVQRETPVQSAARSDTTPTDDGAHTDTPQRTGTESQSDAATNSLTEVPEERAYMKQPDAVVVDRQTGAIEPVIVPKTETVTVGGRGGASPESPTKIPVIEAAPEDPVEEVAEILEEATTPAPSIEKVDTQKIPAPVPDKTVPDPVVSNDTVETSASVESSVVIDDQGVDISGEHITEHTVEIVAMPDIPSLPRNSETKHTPAERTESPLEIPKAMDIVRPVSVSR